MCSQTFGNFKVWNEDSQIAKSVALSYCKNFETIKGRRQNSILLCGQVGSGKSHLSIAIAINMLKNNINVIYMPYRDMITKIKQNITDIEYYRKFIGRYQKCQVLLIDDLFKGKITESDINIIFEIINYRYQNYLPVIISTEFTVEEMQDFDEACGSRIYEMCRDYVVEIEKGMDRNYRLW